MHGGQERERQRPKDKDGFNEICEHLKVQEAQVV